MEIKPEADKVEIESERLEDGKRLIPELRKQSMCPSPNSQGQQVDHQTENCIWMSENSPNTFQALQGCAFEMEIWEMETDSTSKVKLVAWIQECFTRFDIFSSLYSGCGRKSIFLKHVQN